MAASGDGWKDSLWARTAAWLAWARSHSMHAPNRSVPERAQRTAARPYPEDPTGCCSRLPVGALGRACSAGNRPGASRHSQRVHTRSKSSRAQSTKSFWCTQHPSLAGAGEAQAQEELRAEHTRRHALLRQARPACLRQTDIQQSRGLQPTPSSRHQHRCHPHVTSIACGRPRSCCLC